MRIDLKAPALICRSLGGLRTRLVWRGIAVAICMDQAIMSGGLFHLLEDAERHDLTFHAETIVAVLMMVLGPSFLTLAMLSIGSALYVWPFMVHREGMMLGEEMTLFLLLPLIAFTLTVLVMWRSRELQQSSDAVIPESVQSELETVHLSLFRIATVTSLFWAAIHKLNDDFFDRSVSCATMLGGLLIRWWDVPLVDTFLPLEPWQVIVGESSLPVLLTFYPLVGILVALLFLVPIGSIGPTGFTMSLLSLSLAFLRREDGRAFLGTLRQSWPFLLGGYVTLAVLCSQNYLGPGDWKDMAIYQSMGFTIAFGTAGALGASARRKLRDGGSPGLLLRSLIPELGWKRLLPPEPVSRGVLMVAAGVMLVNGLTPYLGFKYRMSFAMLSNLRVDKDRWNHAIIPGAVSLFEHDPFVRVTAVSYPPGAREKLAAAGIEGLEPGLASPLGLKKQVVNFMILRISLDLDVIYHDRKHQWDDAIHDDTFLKWLSELPSSKMFQDHLTLGTPQSCVH